MPSNPPQDYHYVFRGYMRPTLRGTVLAECVDLDLLVEADTAEQAMAKMRDAMKGYLAIAFERDDPSDLIPRRSPLSSWLWFWGIYCCWKIQRVQRNALRVFDFPYDDGLAETTC